MTIHRIAVGTYRITLGGIRLVLEVMRRGKDSRGVG